MGPRRAFGTTDRFPMADTISHNGEQALASIGLAHSAAVAAVSRDPRSTTLKAIAALQPSPAFYVAALGSGETNRQRLVRLKEAGLWKQEHVAPRPSGSAWGPSQRRSHWRWRRLSPSVRLAARHPSR
jgi:hypothetical protein